MHHYIAFLRGINLGKRRLTMDVLRTRFEELKFTNVATFIASGNVVFSSKSADPAKLTRQIEQHLEETLGYSVDTFLRTRGEVARVAAFRPFSAADHTHPAHTIFGGFWHEPLSPAQAKGLVACRTEVDEFCVEGREYYWLCRIKSNESKVWASRTLRALELPTSSMRNLNTIRKLAELYPAPKP